MTISPNPYRGFRHPPQGDPAHGMAVSLLQLAVEVERWCKRQGKSARRTLVQPSSRVWTIGHPTRLRLGGCSRRVTNCSKDGPAQAASSSSPTPAPTPAAPLTTLLQPSMPPDSPEGIESQIAIKRNCSTSNSEK